MLALLTVIGFLFFSLLGRLSIFTVLTVAFSGAGLLFIVTIINIMLKG